MATYTCGADNNTNTPAANLASANTVYLSSFLPTEAGTLDSVSVYVDATASSPRFRVGVWQGGNSETDATGATLIWDSGEKTPTDTTSAGDPYWATMTKASGTGTGAISVARTWIGVMVVSCRAHSASTTDNDEQSIPFSNTTDLRVYSAASLWTNVQSSGLAYVSPIPSSSSQSSTTVLKAYLTYTTSSASVAPFASQRNPVGFSLAAHLNGLGSTTY